MPSIGHLAVGLAAGRVTQPPSGLEPRLWTLLLVAASSAPDLDVLAFPLGIPYGAALGHRGATHSLVFAGLSGCALGLGARMLGLPALRVILGVSLVMASHGVLDTFTDGGRGVALFWPFENHRYFAPWRPIPVSPIGIGIFSRRGLYVMSYESLLFLPLIVMAAWPPRRNENS
jgi:inner membrane protein